MKDLLYDELALTIAHQNFPCIGAQKALKDKTIGFYKCAQTLKHVESPILVAKSFYEWMYKMEYKDHSCWPALKLASFVVVFEQDTYSNEDDLEQDFWQFLGRLHHYDQMQFPWDSAFEPFVYGSNFAFSLGGVGHFVPVLSPIASSLVRRLPHVALVFNPHFVFQKLRTQRLFDNWRTIIRSRELKVQGWINPKLSDAGLGYEAPQYALTKNPVFDIGACPFTGNLRPGNFSQYSF